MAADANSSGDGSTSPANMDAQSETPTQDPWEQPLYMIPRRGRPSNWAKKFAVQQAKTVAQQSENNEEPIQTQPDRGPTPQKAKRRRAAKPRACKPTRVTPSPEPSASLLTAATSPVQATPSPSSSPAPAQPPARMDNDGSQVLSDNDSLFNGDAGSLLGGDDEPEESPAVPSADNSSLFVGDDEPVQLEDIRPIEQNGIRDIFSPESDEVAQNAPIPSASRDHTKLEAELATMADEVRRWEAVTQQVAFETKEMAKLVRDLAASSFSSKPPSATVRDMLSPEDQAKFRDQLLKATQLSLKADLIQTLKERDSESREQQAYCVVVLAVAVVAAAFLVSPFATWVVEGFERVIDRFGLL